MTERVGSIRPGGRSEHVRRAILEATQEVLGDVGWAGFSVEAVARRAGVHKTTVYRRWPNRLELAVAALADRGEAFVAIADTGSLRGDLRALARSVRANLADAHGAELARAMVAEMAVDPDVRRVVEAFFSERFGHAGQIIQRAVARGELPASVDAYLLVESVVAPTWFRFLTTGELPAGYEAERVVDLLLDGALPPCGA